jgi:hypothetical protein
MTHPPSAFYWGLVIFSAAVATLLVLVIRRNIAGSGRAREIELLHRSNNHRRHLLRRAEMCEHLQAAIGEARRRAAEAEAALAAATTAADAEPLLLAAERAAARAEEAARAALLTDQAIKAHGGPKPGAAEAAADTSAIAEAAAAARSAAQSVAQARAARA